jgi:hypothetical protein
MLRNPDELLIRCPPRQFGTTSGLLRQIREFSAFCGPKMGVGGGFIGLDLDEPQERRNVVPFSDGTGHGACATVVSHSLRAFSAVSSGHISSRGPKIRTSLRSCASRDRPAFGFQ